MNTLKRLFHDREMLCHLLRYGLVGCGNTAVDLTLFWVLKHWLDPTVADALALLVAMTCAYIAHKNLVFRTHQPTMSALLREMAAFYGERAVTGCINVGCMYLFATRLGLWPMGVKVVVTGCILVVDYLASRLLVFRHRHRRGPDHH
jgi:putative flippase GtrA